MHDVINDEYFMWLLSLVCGRKHSEKYSFEKLLRYLHNTEFRYSILRDENRAEDGMDLRYRFACHVGVEAVESDLDGPCSVLEMMIALALRCEETIMCDDDIGDRTKQWFWMMVTNMGLGSMSDDRFDRRYVKGVVECFLDRDYEPDGRGGLFVIRNCEQDLRDVEIWYQLHWYLDTIG